ncbi:MAG: hypothetical protein JWQ34_2172 [Mucilaginibacter sp.]|uniref:hypothetical protein n=1 Tax=Mucilaginibacter sp. TaxID=1882438 RepID=UPI00262D2844|nr:hypothetical protein [Mucilaginibacter sp.]MDB5003947.1 hypothetical protein [Mucilaginibacter sp.]
MNTKLKIALSLAFTAVAFTASAQKTYTQGVATYSLKTAMGDGESKVSFTADSNVAVTQQGPATIKMLTNSKATYFAILVDVPVASMKKAAVLTPDEIDQFVAAAPKFTFTPTTETKVINGFNCKKVDVKDTKSGSSYTAWITNDIVLPVNVLTKPFIDAGGAPIQFTSIQQGQPVNVTLKSVSEEKVPVGSFGIAGFDKISLDDLKAMSGGK